MIGRVTCRISSKSAMARSVYKAFSSVPAPAAPSTIPSLDDTVIITKACANVSDRAMLLINELYSFNRLGGLTFLRSTRRNSHLSCQNLRDLI